MYHDISCAKVSWPTKFWEACYSTLPGPSNTSSPRFRSLSSSSSSSSCSCSSFALPSPPPPPHLFFFCYCCCCFFLLCLGPSTWATNQWLHLQKKMPNPPPSLLSSQQQSEVHCEGVGHHEPFLHPHGNAAWLDLTHASTDAMSPWVRLSSHVQKSACLSILSPARSSLLLSLPISTALLEVCKDRHRCPI